MMSIELNSHFTNLINEIYNTHCQNYYIYQKKEKIRQKLYDLLRIRLNEDFDLFIVGSTQTQFALSSSDLDLCLVIYDKNGSVDQEYISTKYKTINKLVQIRDIVQSNNLCFRDELIKKAIVPIFKFIYNSEAKIAVDLNINRKETICNTFLLTCYKLVDQRVAPLVVAVKSWARKFGINSSYQNTLSSFNLTLMVIHFLQNGCYPPVLPRIQTMFPNDFFEKIHTTGTMNDSLSYFESILNLKFKCENTSSLGQLFANFIRYFNQPGIFRNVISIRNIPLPYCRMYNSSYIMIEDPFELKNTAYSVYIFNKFEYIKHAFRKAHESLCNGTFSEKDFD